MNIKWVVVALFAALTLWVSFVVAWVDGTEVEVFDTTVQSRVVSAGDYLIVERDVRATGKVVVVVRRLIENSESGLQYPMSNLTIGLKEGVSSRSVAVKIPEILPNGEYIYRADLRYRASLWFDALTIPPPVRFTVQ